MWIIGLIHITSDQSRHSKRGLLWIDCNVIRSKFLRASTFIFIQCHTYKHAFGQRLTTANKCSILIHAHSRIFDSTPKIVLHRQRNTQQRSIIHTLYTLYMYTHTVLTYKQVFCMTIKKGRAQIFDRISEKMRGL